MRPEEAIFQRLPAALPPDHDDDDGRAARRPAAGARHRHGLGAAPPARHRDRRRSAVQPDADALHDARHLPALPIGFRIRMGGAASRRRCESPRSGSHDLSTNMSSAPAAAGGSGDVGHVRWDPSHIKPADREHRPAFKEGALLGRRPVDARWKPLPTRRTPPSKRNWWEVFGDPRSARGGAGHRFRTRTLPRPRLRFAQHGRRLAGRAPDSSRRSRSGPSRAPPVRQRIDPASRTRSTGALQPTISCPSTSHAGRRAGAESAGTFRRTVQSRKPPPPTSRR